MLDYTITTSGLMMPAVPYDNTTKVGSLTEVRVPTPWHQTVLHYSKSFPPGVQNTESDIDWNGHTP